MRANPGRFEFGTVEDPHTRQDFQAMDLISRQWNLWRRSPPNVKNEKVSPEFVAPWRSSWQCPVLSVPRRWDQRWRSGRPKWQTKWQRLLRKVKLFAPTSLWPGTCRQPFESTGSADCIWKTPNPNTCTTNKNCCLHWHVIRWCIIQHTSQSTRVRAVVRPKSWEGLGFLSSCNDWTYFVGAIIASAVMTLGRSCERWQIYCCQVIIFTISVWNIAACPQTASIRLWVNTYQYLWIPFFGGWTPIDPSCSNVNRSGAEFWPRSIFKPGRICGWKREYTRSGNLIYTQRRSDSLRSQVPSSKRCAQLDFALLEFGVGNDLWSFRLTSYFGMILVQAMKLAQPDLESMIHEKCLGPDQGAGGYSGIGWCWGNWWPAHPRNIKDAKDAGDLARLFLPFTSKNVSWHMAELGRLRTACKRGSIWWFFVKSYEIRSLWLIDRFLPKEGYV